MRLMKTTKYQKIAALDAMLFSSDDPIEGWSQAHWWIGIEDGLPVCYCGIKDLGSGIGYLNRSGVLPGSQGNGYQKKMIKKRLEWAKSNGLDAVVTDTITTNPASVNSLISNGFRQFIPANQWAGPSALYWIRRIDGKNNHQ